MNPDYHLGLLCLAHLLISADGVVDINEIDAMGIIRKQENIPDNIYHSFDQIKKVQKERELYQTGIELINRCSDEEKLRLFAILYKLSEVDGRVHVKEIRLLLYSIKLTKVEFEDVVNAALTIPPLL